MSWVMSNMFKLNGCVQNKGEAQHENSHGEILGSTRGFLGAHAQRNPGDTSG